MTWTAVGIVSSAWVQASAVFWSEVVSGRLGRWLSEIWMNSGKHVGKRQLMGNETLQEIMARFEDDEGAIRALNEAMALPRDQFVGDEEFDLSRFPALMNDTILTDSDATPQDVALEIKEVRAATGQFVWGPVGGSPVGKLGKRQTIRLCGTDEMTIVVNVWAPEYKNQQPPCGNPKDAGNQASAIAALLNGKMNLSSYHTSGVCLTGYTPWCGSSYRVGVLLGKNRCSHNSNHKCGDFKLFN